MHMMRAAWYVQNKGMAVQETWLLSEFCDKGNIDRALCGGQFRNKACKPEMVRKDPITARHRVLQRCLWPCRQPAGLMVSISMSVLCSSCLSVMSRAVSSKCAS